MKLGYYKVLRILVGVKAPTDESAVRTKVHEQVAQWIVSVRFTVHIKIGYTYIRRFVMHD